MLSTKSFVAVYVVGYPGLSVLPLNATPHACPSLSLDDFRPRGRLLGPQPCTIPLPRRLEALILA